MRVRYFTYLVLHHNGRVYMRKRTGNDIWQGLHEFPYIETDQPLSTGLFLDEQILQSLTADAILENTSKEYRHQLSHQQIRAVFVRARLQGPINEAQQQKWGVQALTEVEIEQIGKPIMLDNYLKINRF